MSLKWDSSHYRRTETEIEATKVAEETAKECDKKYIICDNKSIVINWEKVITHKNSDGLAMPENCYKKVKNKRIPSMFVVHWDVCLSSQSCFNVLKNRGISVHFCIDNDGTIYQLMDCNDIGFHAGNWKANTKSVGVEISNAYYLRYQSTYKLKGFNERPVITDAEVHGRTLEPHLGFYPIQLEALQALATALNEAYDIPLHSPAATTVVPEAVDATYNGVINHYHLTKRKIDCAGLDLNNLLNK